jgi:phosphoglycolate phosphatase
MREIHNILFDLDGTLVDSSGAIRASLTYALERMGACFPAERAVGSMIGLPLLEIFREKFGVVGAEADQAIAHYREHYEAQAAAGTRVYEHVRETLALLHDAGLRLFVATVKPAPIAKKVLCDMQLQPFFSGVAGSSMDHARRDKAEIIRHALRAYGLDASHSVMIGDRGQDIDGARKNGVYAVAVTWGFGSAEELSIAGPDHVVGCASEIPALLSWPLAAGA